MENSILLVTLTLLKAINQHLMTVLFGVTLLHDKELYFYEIFYSPTLSFTTLLLIIYQKSFISAHRR